MSDFDTLKSQILAIMTVKSDGSSINNILYTFIVMSIIQWVFKILPTASEKIGKLVENYIQMKTKNNNGFISKLDTKLTKAEAFNAIKSSIIFKRVFNNNNSVGTNTQQITTTNSFDYEICDALLERMASLDNVKSLEFNKIYYINHKEEFQIEKDINAKMLKIELTTSGDLQSLEFILSSTVLSLSELHNYINSVLQYSKIKKQNKLGNQLYYFNERIRPLMKDTNGNIVYTNAPETIAFSMTKFFTNKNINSTFGDNIHIVKDRLNWFINNPDWYQKKGIPYTFGLLIHGEPGCGKTSMCKVIANMTKRHIVNISLNPYTTKRQLHNLFFDERIQIEKPGGMHENLVIPIDKRVYIIEDIDCMSDVVIDRELKENKKIDTTKAIINDNSDDEDVFKNYDDDDEYSINPVLVQKAFNKQIKKEAKKEAKKEKGLSSEDIFGEKSKIDENLDDKLTLSFLLNLLDGVLETPGRILIMTSNYPQKLDKALIRPGRVDINICFKKCSEKVIIEMIKYFYDNFNESLLQNKVFKNNYYTPAEVYQILFKYINDPENAINELENCK
jgi:hypothetical protein